MSPVLFFDPGCPAPYSRRSLDEAALGGTEATVVRIAEALDAWVVQHNRTEAEGRYRPAREGSGPDHPDAMPDRGSIARQRIEHLIVLRDPRALQPLHDRFPDARPYIWLHDLVRPGSKRGRRLAGEAATLAALGATLICVSDFQRAQAEAVLERAGVAERVRAVTLYNPIDDALAPDGSAVDPDMLVFCSSPNKGLALTLDAFAAVRREWPSMRLRVGSPGYRSARKAGLRRFPGKASGVEWLGPQPHARMLAEVRTALCVFYPNFVLPETFGLVLAEANAVGTPVLTHDCGAASEVLDDPRQLLPITPRVRRYERITRLAPAAARPALASCARRCGVFAPYVERVGAWRGGERPNVVPDPRFRLATVIERWRALLRVARPA